MNYHRIKWLLVSGLAISAAVVTTKVQAVPDYCLTTAKAAALTINMANSGMSVDDVLAVVNTDIKLSAARVGITQAEWTHFIAGVRFAIDNAGPGTDPKLVAEAAYKMCVMVSI